MTLWRATPASEAGVSLGTGSDSISAFVRRQIWPALAMKCGVTVGVTVATLQPAIVSPSGLWSAALEAFRQRIPSHRWMWPAPRAVAQLLPAGRCLKTSLALFSAARCLFLAAAPRLPCASRVSACFPSLWAPVSNPCATA